MAPAEGFADAGVSPSSLSQVLRRSEKGFIVPMFTILLKGSVTKSKLYSHQVDGRSIVSTLREGHEVSHNYKNIAPLELGPCLNGSRRTKRLLR